MSRKTKEEAEKTRTRIIASALSLFVRKGYEHTTFTDIAERLKLTKGAVYWYFESKEALLVELVNLALAKFQRQIENLLPTGELTYPAIAEMMVQNARVIVAAPRDAAFFRLMKCQLRWTDDSMAGVREKLLSDEKIGPKETFKKAIQNDIAAGRVRSTVDAEEVATISIALWDGLVQAKLDHFLESDMAMMLSHAYEAIWQQVKVA